nr:hypothetical protein GCM10020092_019320 [Actinoplanes digitatis]
MRTTSTNSRPPRPARRGCELHENATQVVFGRGAAHARLVLVGEQPGDIEDQKGLPFVGPAVRLLRDAVGDSRHRPVGDLPDQHRETLPLRTAR